jgi:ribosome biogenesis GTPase
LTSSDLPLPPARDLAVPDGAPGPPGARRPLRVRRAHPGRPAAAAALPPPSDATVGDWLAVTDDAVLAVLPRTSLLVRGAVSGESRTQPLAANVDVVLVCASLSGPLPVRRVERLLLLAWESGATPVVVLTKADLHPDPEQAVLELAPHAPGVDVLTVRAADGDVARSRRTAAPGTTLVLLGASGTGKSTVVNALAGGAVMDVGAVRSVDDKGRHTTTHRELVVLPSGAVVIDTPGLRGVAVAGSEEGMSRAFSDVEELATACRFADCAHVGEPGCAVQASIDAGDLSASASPPGTSSSASSPSRPGAPTRGCARRRRRSGSRCTGPSASGGPPVGSRR